LRRGTSPRIIIFDTESNQKNRKDWQRAKYVFDNYKDRKSLKTIFIYFEIPPSNEKGSFLVPIKIKSSSINIAQKLANEELDRFIFSPKESFIRRFLEKRFGVKRVQQLSYSKLESLIQTNTLNNYLAIFRVW